MLNTLAGIHNNYTGSFFLDDISGTDRKAYQKCLGYAPDRLELSFNLSVESFLESHARLYGIERKLIVKAVETAMEISGLEDMCEERINSFSKGFKKRVLLAHAILHNPKYLFLDEPYEGLDKFQKQKLKLFILDRLKKKQSTIISTHELGEASMVCTNVLFLRDKGISNLYNIDSAQDLEKLYFENVW